jgi:hypothetical protein
MGISGEEVLAEKHKKDGRFFDWNCLFPFPYLTFFSPGKRNHVNGNIFSCYLCSKTLCMQQMMQFSLKITGQFRCCSYY